MRIAIFGLGYVGTTAAGCLADLGHSIVGIDPREEKVALINAGRSPVAEPGLDALIAAAVAAGRLEARREIGDALDRCEVAIVCVGTPSGPDGGHNMGQIAQVTRAIAAAIDADRSFPLTLAYRSTMRPGTCEQMIAPILSAALGERAAERVELVYNPEFLREGSAIADFRAPSRIVVGTPGARPSAAMARLHAGIEAPLFTVPLREAELTKFVDNAWHATKVAFANEIGRLCQTLGLSAATVHELFLADTKLNLSGAYLRPGNAFGGSCLPKDVRALQRLAADQGVSTQLIDALLRSNDAHKHHQFLAATRGLAPGARVLLVGLAFKEGTDDLRESPAVDLARRLLDAGYRLDIYDPVLRPEALVGQNLGFAYAHLPSIDALLVDRQHAESQRYDRVIATGRAWRDLALDRGDVVDIAAMA